MGITSTNVATPPAQHTWIDTYQRLFPSWKSLALSHQSSIPISISRVNQFDAARLDIEMSAMLKEQLVKVFSLMKPGMLFQYEPELDAFLEFLIWRFSVWVDKPTPGNALMNLRYRDERAVEARARGKLEQAWRDLALQLLKSFGIASVLLVDSIYGPAYNHFLLFVGGVTLSRCRNLIERALRARLVYGTPNMNRAVSFEYMNRQLVWNEFSEMSLLLLPLLNSSTFKNIFRPLLNDKSSSSIEDDTRCPICQANPATPFLALPCQHWYCYYCLRTRCAAAASFRCSRCSEQVIAMQRYGVIDHKVPSQ